MIFSKLSMTYGRDFLSRYEGQDLQAVKAEWANRLAGLQNRRWAITHALETIGVKPPNSIEFKEACSRAPDPPPVLSIDAPAANPDVIRRALTDARGATKTVVGNLDRARDLRRRELNGDKSLTKAQREFWRIALKRELEAQQ